MVVFKVTTAVMDKDDYSSLSGKEQRWKKTKYLPSFATEISTCDLLRLNGSCRNDRSNPTDATTSPARIVSGSKPNTAVKVVFLPLPPLICLTLSLPPSARGIPSAPLRSNLLWFPFCHCCIRLPVLN